jgi:NitT/TauT family transport system substrate-binding protein
MERARTARLAGLLAHGAVARIGCVALGVLIATGLTATIARADSKIGFTLDWIPGAVHAPFFIALYKGYYKGEGLDVTIDRGKGSAEVVRQLASGVYDRGFPDINILMNFNSKNRDQAFPVLMMGYEQAPAAIIVLIKWHHDA